MERRLVILEIVVGVAPLLGLLGTIYGLIELFGGLAEAGLGDNSALARGIALALYSTLLGLLTAIPSLVAWSYYNRKVGESGGGNGGAVRRVFHSAIPPRRGDGGRKDAARRRP